MQPVRIQKHRCIFQPSHRCLLSFDRLHFETSVISGFFSASNLDNLKKFAKHSVFFLCDEYSVLVFLVF